MGQVKKLTFASSLVHLQEANSSFDTGVLRIAYSGKNRNNTNISKETFEKCIGSIYYTPIVCNYDRETDTIGSHDVKVIKDKNGKIKLINLTTPIGCVPESSRWFWESVTEDDGTVNEYLHADVLIWKRQEAYEKIKNDGCISQSMEINVKEGKTIDGVYTITDFEFTAFTLIGVEPCFESASLECSENEEDDIKSKDYVLTETSSFSFGTNDFRNQFSQMMDEMKECLTQLDASKEVVNINYENNSEKGGEVRLNEDINEVVDTTVETLDTIDTVENTDIDNEDLTEAEDQVESFDLSRNIREALVEALRESLPKKAYYYVDHDESLSEVYALNYDMYAEALYGMKYSFEGDKAVIDFESCTRKKFVIADYVEGDAAINLTFVSDIISQGNECAEKYTALEEKYEKDLQDYNSLKEEIETLRTFKANTEKQIAESKRDAILEQFSDLAGVEAFEALKTMVTEDVFSMNCDDLEEKCFALKGKFAVYSRAIKENRPKLIVDKSATEKEEDPYGGIMRKFGVVKD